MRAWDLTVQCSAVQCSADEVNDNGSNVDQEKE